MNIYCCMCVHVMCECVRDCACCMSACVTVRAWLCVLCGIPTRTPFSRYNLRFTLYRRRCPAGYFVLPWYNTALTPTKSNWGRSLVLSHFTNEPHRLYWDLFSRYIDLYKPISIAAAVTDGSLVDKRTHISKWHEWVYQFTLLWTDP